MDYTTGGHGDWLARLEGLSRDYMAVSTGLRERIDTCVGWLDVAARSDRWQIILPAVFSAMEAILVPEVSSALKAGVVTVRSVAVHVALDDGFFDPGEIMLGYGLRSDLVHGTPTSGVPDKEAADFSESRRRWAFNVFQDYLILAKKIGAASSADIINHLDRGHCGNVCAWLDEHGGSAIVAEYRRSLVPKGQGLGIVALCPFRSWRAESEGGQGRGWRRGRGGGRRRRCWGARLSLRIPMARLRRVAMTWGPLPVRIWEASSP